MEQAPTDRSLPRTASSSASDPSDGLRGRPAEPTVIISRRPGPDRRRRLSDRPFRGEPAPRRRPLGRPLERARDLRSPRVAPSLDGLAEAGYDAIPIEIRRDGSLGAAAERRTQRRGRPEGEAANGASRRRSGALDGRGPAPFGTVDVVFPALHGPFGEDGTVQGLLELAGVPYVGPGVAASAVSMDKDLFKAVMRANDIPVTRSVTVRRPSRARPESPFGFPVVVKPARLGSSVGITIVRDAGAARGALELAFAHDEKVLLEEFVSRHRGRVQRARQRAAARVRRRRDRAAASDWYDFASKYDEGGMELVVPARITPEQAPARRSSR